MMYTVANPFRLDQGDVSFDAPDTVKEAMRRGLDENRTHYVLTQGLPRLRELIVEKLRGRNGVPVASPDDVLVTNGGIHAVYVACHGLLEPGDEVIIPDPAWPQTPSIILSARGVPVRCPLHESLGWRYDLDQLASMITPRTRAIYINSPHNPTGGVLTRGDVEAIAGMADRHRLWILSDEAYEDVLFDGASHVSIASLAGTYERSLPIYTFSKSYAITGLRLGYVAVPDPVLRGRMMKVLSVTASNVSSLVQYGGIGALEGSQSCIVEFRRELHARRDMFYAGIERAAADVFTGTPPKGAFYAFLRIDDGWQATPSAHPKGVPASRSWALVEELITRASIGCVPGVDFGPRGENYVRFCFARERRELEGALNAMGRLFGS
jgi:aspartate aminotransferase